MKKSVKILIAVLAVVFVGSIVGAVLYQKHVLEQRQEQLVFVYRAIGYSRDLTIDMGANSYDLNVETGECNEDMLYNFTITEPQIAYIRVAYFRLETGSTSTYDDVIDSYRAYLNKDDDGAATMRMFHMSRVNDTYAVINGEEIRETIFEHMVIAKIKELYGIPYCDATFEQIDKAIETVVSGENTY